MIPFIDLKEQYGRIETKIQSRINQVLDHGKFIMGPEVFEFEKKLSEFIGVKHAIGVSSGTDALLISLMALGVGVDDEVIIPDFSFFATAEIISLIGAKPVFIDIDNKTYNLDHNLLEAKITKKTKVIMPVSLYGQPAEFDEMNSIAKKYDIPVLEDACQSFGGIYKGKKSCSLSTIGCTSFFPSKPLGCYGDGGAIFTDDDNLAEAMKSIRVHGQAGRYNHPRLGINGRMDTLQAAILLEKLDIFEEELALRQEIAKRYTSALSDKFITPTIHEYNLSAWAQYTIQVENREEFQKCMKENKVPTACHYPKPISKQPYYEGLNILDCPVAAHVATKVVSLPMYPYLSYEAQEQICNACKEIEKDFG